MNILIANACSKALPIIEELLSLLSKNNFNDTTVINLNDKNISPCSACMLCQIKHPGICSKKDDMEELLPLYIGSDVVFFITPIFCGGYSATYKKFLDRLCPVLTACFEKRYEETWHIPRYNKRPKMIGIGISKSSRNVEKIFKDLFERNMRQFFISKYSSFILQEENNFSQIRK